ncbi:peptidyl-prolyl cis-trans isomerase, partial [Fragilariopsis cylindrus CCMP1102]
GDTVTVAYKGTLNSNGYLFDSAKNFTFVLGAGDVIKGWDQGIQNMKVGHKRKLIVPSQLGYGKRGCKPDIPPNSILNFIITLKKIE